MPTCALLSRVVAIKAQHGQWLCAEPPHFFNGGPVIANRDKCGKWEYWTLDVYADKTVSLRSCHGFYLCAEPSGMKQICQTLNARKISAGYMNLSTHAGEVVADREAVGPWEQWTLVTHDSLASLQSYHGHFLCLEPCGTVVADRVECGPWEKFQLVDHDGNAYDPHYYVNELCTLEIIGKREEVLMRGVIAAAEAATTDARLRLISAGCTEFSSCSRNVAVVGVIGSGKSTVINFLLKEGGERAEMPSLGMVKATHPALHSTCIWEIAGVNRRDGFADSYWNDTCLDAFDAIALVINTRRFSPFCEYIIRTAIARKRPLLIVHTDGARRAELIVANKKISRAAANVELRMRLRATVSDTFDCVGEAVRVFCVECSSLRPDEWMLDEKELMEYCFGWLSGGGLPSSADYT